MEVWWSDVRFPVVALLMDVRVTQVAFAWLFVRDRVAQGWRVRGARFGRCRRASCIGMHEHNLCNVVARRLRKLGALSLGTWGRSYTQGGRELAGQAGDAMPASRQSLLTRGVQAARSVRARCLCLAVHWRLGALRGAPGLCSGGGSGGTPLLP